MPIKDGFAGVALIEIFAPIQGHNTTFYPVTIDGLKTSFECIDIWKWSAKGFGNAFSEDLIEFIGDTIEHYEI